jgi:hypothetical protein
MTGKVDPYRNNPARYIEDYAVEAVRSWVGSSGSVSNIGQGTSGGPDIEIIYNDGHTAIGEVGWHQDREIQAMWAETHKRKDAQQVALSPGAGQWMVSLSRGASIKNLYRELPSLIGDLLAQGETQLMIQGTWPPGPTADSARRLGIEDMSRVNNSSPARAIFFMPGSGGVVPQDPNVIVTWIDEVVADSRYLDMTSKLLKLSADERHIFIMSGGLTPFGVEEGLGRLDQALPTIGPTVPKGITHVWVASRFKFNEESSLGLWRSSSGWAKVPRPN